MSTYAEFIILGVAGLVAGFINAAAGGGSLLTLPALIFTGLDASSANATNRIAVLFQSVAAGATYHRKGVRAAAGLTRLALPVIAAAGAGSYVATLISPEDLKLVIAIAMLLFLGVLIRPKPSPVPEDMPAAEKHPLRPLGLIAIGFYAGFLQAGVGIVMLLFLGWVYRLDLIRANLMKVFYIALLTVMALGVFYLQGVAIDLPRGLLLAGTTTIGAMIGARVAFQGGERYVRVLLVVAVGVSAVKLLTDALTSIGI